MSETTSIRMPDWALKASRDVIRCVFSEQSMHESIASAVEIITGCEAFGLSSAVAIYVEEERDFSHKLFFHHDVAWTDIPRLIEPDADMHAHAATIGGKDVCFVPLIACNDHCHIGTALFFPAGDILPDGELLPILQSISGDLTALIVSKRKATVNSQLADIAGMSPNEIYMIDPKSLEIIRANKSAQINTGYRPDQIMRMTPIDLKDGISEEQYRELLQPLVSGQTGCVSFEAR